MNYTKGEWKQGKRHTDTVYMADENTRIATCFSPNSEANAQLIASAPALYEALKRIKRNCFKDKRGAYWIGRVDMANAEQALASVEGK